MFHYCNPDKFSSILKSKKIWLTPVELMKDRAEIIHLYEQIWKQVKQTLLQRFNDDWSVRTLEMVEDDINNIALYTDMPYCCCCSDDGDLLSQWIRYADDGKGFSIGFDSSLLGVKQSLPHPSTDIRNSIGVGEVIYRYGEQVNALLQIIGSVLSNPSYNALDWITIKLNLKYYSAVFKNDTFYTERERRVIYYYQKDHVFEPSFITGPFDYYDKQRFDLNWFISENQHAITRVFLGPKNTISTNDATQLLSSFGISLNKDCISKSRSTYI